MPNNAIRAIEYMKEITNYAYLENLELSEYVAFPVYIIIILMISYYIQLRNVKTNPIYKYYTRGVLVKLLGAVVFCLVYIFYYKGGDTITYYETARALANLFRVHPDDFMKVVFEAPSPENYFLFDGRITGFPWPYMYYNPQTFLVTKLVCPFLILTFNSYMLSTILFSWISFIGIWKLFKMLSIYLKEDVGKIAFAVLFIPSVVFWGSGIMKDTITFSATCWFVYAFHNVLILKKKRVVNIISMIIMGYLIVAIKPYIMYALLPGAIIWLFHSKIVKIKSSFIRYSIIPLIYVVGMGGGMVLLGSISNFNLNSAIFAAVEKQSDLKQGYYKGSSFDIGKTDASINGVLTKAPSALLAGLFRPFVFEAKNVMMILSGIENAIYLYFTIIILIRLRVKNFFKLIFNNPIVLFSLSYVILLSFIVGISTSNFGAMVRFKIPYLPFFMAALFIMDRYSKRKLS